MAKMIKKHEFKRRKYRAYPWQKWTNGRIWRIDEGIDYDDERTVCASIYNRAKRLGMTVQINRCRGHVKFQFRKDNEQ